MKWVLEASNGETDEFDSRSAAMAAKDNLAGLPLDADVHPKEQTVSDGGEVAVPVQDDGEVSVAETDADTVDLPASPPVDEDPLTWMPDHFVDTIEDEPAINRKGYAVLAEHYGISVTTTPLTIPSESDWEYAEFRAVATTADGREYTGFGSAHVERGDDKVVLGEMAETRAEKRATASATGVGMLAVEEMKAGTVEGGADQ
jgi:hypothetical protein